MEEMISEILHEDFRRSIRLGDLQQYVFSQISPFDWRETVLLSAAKEILDERVTVNVVRFSRALVNLLENAYRANRLAGGGRIVMSISETEGHAEIAITDEGPGFRSSFQPAQPVAESGLMEEYSLPGYLPAGSGWNSTGLGLQYVKMVVKNHGGRFFVQNLPERGARTVILLAKSVAAGPCEHDASAARTKQERVR